RVGQWESSDAPSPADNNLARACTAVHRGSTGCDTLSMRTTRELQRHAAELLPRQTARKWQQERQWRLAATRANRVLLCSAMLEQPSLYQQPDRPAYAYSRAPQLLLATSAQEWHS